MHGYFKIEGKPLLVMAHGTVGLQHASMAIYNAYADRVPVYIILGNIQDINYRRGDVEWAHSVQDAAAMVRDFTKWDDNPVSLSHFAESSVRAYKIAMTPPYEPVVIVADAVLQEEPMPEADRRNARIPKLALSAPPAEDSGAVAEAAKLLVAAENPVIVRARGAACSWRGRPGWTRRTDDQTTGSSSARLTGVTLNAPVPAVGTERWKRASRLVTRPWVIQMVHRLARPTGY